MQINSRLFPQTNPFHYKFKKALFTANKNHHALKIYQHFMFKIRAHSAKTTWFSITAIQLTLDQLSKIFFIPRLSLITWPFKGKEEKAEGSAETGRWTIEVWKGFKQTLFCETWYCRIALCK